MSHEEKKPTLVSTETFETKTNQQLTDELAAIDLENKQLDLELKREQVTKLRAQIEQKKSDAKSRTLAIQQYMAQRTAQQENCNHSKGGGRDTFMTGQGDSTNRSVIKHKLPSGKYMVLCQRCGKEWHPADKFDARVKETPGYQDALRFLTDNSASGSSTFIFERTGV